VLLRAAAHLASCPVDLAALGMAPLDLAPHDSTLLAATFPGRPPNILFIERLES
jgi:hypothetical protein